MSTASSGELGRDESPADDPSGSQSPLPRIVLPVPPPEIRANLQWLNKQTIANIENGVNSSTLVTLAFVSVRLGTRAEDVVIGGR